MSPESTSLSAFSVSGGERTGRDYSADTGLPLSAATPTPQSPQGQSSEAEGRPPGSCPSALFLRPRELPPAGGPALPGRFPGPTDLRRLSRRGFGRYFHSHTHFPGPHLVRSESPSRPQAFTSSCTPPAPLGANPALRGRRPPPFSISLHQCSHEAVFFRAGVGGACFLPGKVATFSFQILSVGTCGRQVTPRTHAGGPLCHLVPGKPGHGVHAAAHRDSTVDGPTPGKFHKVTDPHSSPRPGGDGR